MRNGMRHEANVQVIGVVLDQGVQNEDDLDDLSYQIWVFDAVR